MTVVIHPKRHTNQKPRIGDRINWSHDLAQGLVFATNLSEGQGAPQDLVQGKVSTFGGSGSWVNNDIQFANTTFVNWGTAAVYHPLVFSATVEFVAQSGTGLIINTRNTFNEGFSINALSGTSLIVGIYNNAVLLGSLTVPLTYGINNTLTITLDKANLLSLYLTPFGGQMSVSTTTLSGPMSYQSGSELRLGADSGTRGFTGRVRNAKMHSRVLSRPEITWLHSEPYAFISPFSTGRFVSLPTLSTVPRRRTWQSIL